MSQLNSLAISMMVLEDRPASRPSAKSELLMMAVVDSTRISLGFSSTLASKPAPFDRMRRLETDECSCTNSSSWPFCPRRIRISCPGLIDARFLASGPAARTRGSVASSISSWLNILARVSPGATSYSCQGSSSSLSAAEASIAVASEVVVGSFTGSSAGGATTADSLVVSVAGSPAAPVSRSCVAKESDPGTGSSRTRTWFSCGVSSGPRPSSR